MRIKLILMIFSFSVKKDTLQGINISHLGKRKIIFKMPSDFLFFFLRILAPLLGKGQVLKVESTPKTDGLGSRKLLRIQPPIHTEELRYTWPDFVCRLPSGRHPLYLWNRHCRSLCRFLCRRSLLAEKNHDQQPVVTQSI